MSIWAKKLRGQDIVQYLSPKKVFKHFFAVINTSVKTFIKSTPRAAAGVINDWAKNKRNDDNNDKR